MPSKTIRSQFNSEMALAESAALRLHQQIESWRKASRQALVDAGETLLQSLSALLAVHTMISSNLETIDAEYQTAVKEWLSNLHSSTVDVEAILATSTASA